MRYIWILLFYYIAFIRRFFPNLLSNEITSLFLTYNHTYTYTYSKHAMNQSFINKYDHWADWKWQKHTKQHQFYYCFCQWISHIIYLAFNFNIFIKANNFSYFGHKIMFARCIGNIILYHNLIDIVLLCCVNKCIFEWYTMVEYKRDKLYSFNWSIGSHQFQLKLTPISGKSG